jgi:hypothetical protein
MFFFGLVFSTPKRMLNDRELTQKKKKKKSHNKNRLFTLTCYDVCHIGTY